MNSTEQDDAGARLVVELATALAALGDSYRQQGRAFFPSGPAANDQSYFVSRTATATVRETLEAPVCRSEEELTQKLQRQWTNDGLPELALLAPQFAHLAVALRADNTRRPDELSPFLYAMF